MEGTRRWQANLRYNLFDLTEVEAPIAISEQQVTRLRLTYQFTPRLFLRAIGEYVTWGGGGACASVDPLLSYKINPFTVFFIGSSHAYTSFANDSFTVGDDSGPRETAHLLRQIPVSVPGVEPGPALPAGCVRDVL